MCHQKLPQVWVENIYFNFESVSLFCVMRMSISRKPTQDIYDDFSRKKAQVSLAKFQRIMI